MRNVTRGRPYSIHTQGASKEWRKRDIQIHPMMSREELAGGGGKVEGFRTDLAVWWKKAAPRTGLAKVIGAHGFRHSLATPWLQRPTDIRTIPALLGHHEGATMNICTRILQPGVHGVGRQLGDL